MKFSQFHKELMEAKKLRNVLSDKEMEKSMKKALADKANWKGGKINWSFIDADMYMELTAKGYDLRHPSVNYMDRFDKLADKLDPEMNESVELEERLEEAKGYYIEVSVRTARKANEILQDQFRNMYKTKGSNHFIFKDEGDAYDAGMALMAQEVEVTKENIGLDESVELGEAFKKGDSVTVKNARKYDSLAKPQVSGTVIGKMGSKIMVKVGSGQMNVDPKDLITESKGSRLDAETLEEARKDAPKGSRETTDENPLVIVYDDEFTKGKPSMSGMMNLQTWMSIHGISQKFQAELATMALKAGAGKQVEVSKKILKDTHDEYKAEDKRPRRYWIELSKHHAKEVK